MRPQVILITLLCLFIGQLNAQKINQQFFQDVDALLKQEVQGNLVDYTSIKENPQLKQLIQTIETADISGLDANTRKAFYINAYNLQVINMAAEDYPLNSVQDVAGFFERKKVTVAGEKTTLNNLEKNQLLKPYQDGRLHFVLVCGALGCPPITNFAYTPDQLDTQLSQQTTKALDDANFLRADGHKVELSEIFSWYPEDFGGTRANIIKFINQYRTYTIPTTAKFSYYTYDWSLNDTATQGSAGASGGNNTARYIVSSTIPKGTFEFKIFNNLYTQRTGSAENLTDRSTFFTTAISALYGLNNRFNIGLAARYRRVRNESLPSSALNVFSSVNEGSARQGLTAIGPQIRYAPVEKWSNFSIQSAFLLPIGSDLTGNATQPFIDWTGATWNTQFFNDFPIGNNFSLFTEIDFLWEDIGSSSNGHINRVSTPATVIFSYNPNRKTTLYALGGFSPFWQSNFDYFAQGGIGAKYQFTPKIELELLFTDFTNKFLSDTGGQAATYNIGFRFNL